MKKTVSLICFLVMLSMLILSSCSRSEGYTPKGEFYAKTPASNGDAGSVCVIDIEFPKKSYECEGDFHTDATVGFGHLPGAYDGEEDGGHLRFECKIIKAPLKADKRASWEMVCDYDSSFYDEQFNSTEKKDSSFLFFPIYGDFYPIYKEKVTIIFPEEVDKGYLEIRIYSVTGESEASELSCLRVYFERDGGALTLEP